MKRYALLFLLLPLACLAADRGAPYACDDGSHLEISFLTTSEGRPQVFVRTANTRLSLPQVATASGALYRSGNIRLHTQGTEIRFEDGKAFTLPGLFEFGFWLSLVIGIAFLGLYSRRIGTEMRSMSDALLATQMALAREQKLTDLGGVIAAAAHELGTPLATIKLVSSEMIDELGENPALLEDAMLIRDQADRCRDILRSMGKAGKDDLHLRYAPLSAVLREAAEPHMDRGKRVIVHIGLQEHQREPLIQRRPEFIHGVRNLVQNAVDFARNTVWIDADWSDAKLVLRIIDDGKGFPVHAIGRIGEPFVRSRRLEATRSERPEYEGMGLGLFIAKTLLERTGAELSFLNASEPFAQKEELPRRCGAIVEVVWPSNVLVGPTETGLGQNLPFT